MDTEDILYTIYEYRAYTDKNLSSYRKIYFACLDYSILRLVYEKVPKRYKEELDIVNKYSYVLE